MDQDDAQVLGLSTAAAGAALALAAAWLASARRRAGRAVRGGLWSLLFAGGGVFVLGLLYSLYAFSPNAGR